MVRTIKDRTRARFDLSIAEVGGLDTWQRVEVGFAIVGSDRDRLEKHLGSIVEFIEEMGVATLLRTERETIVFEGMAAPEGPDTEWVPDGWLEDRDESP